jgi:hypothetical protein
LLGSGVRVYGHYRKGTLDMSNILRSAILAAGCLLALAACTTPNSADAGTQKAQSGPVFVSAPGGGGGGGGSGY